MSTNAPSLPRPVRLARPYRFTRDDYHAMVEAGILAEDDSVELIAGEIVTQMPIGSRHSAIVNRLTQIFSNLARGRCIVSVQNPIALDDFNEPQPDLALLRARADFYEHSLPGPEDIILIVEVADTSLPFDREEKIPLYALTGIPEVWLVNLADKSLSVYRRPEQGEYREQTLQPADGTLAIPGLPEGELNINDLTL